MIQLTLRDLAHRSVRFVVVTVLGAVVFALLFVTTGLVEQFNRESYDTMAAFGADAWVLPEGVSGPFTAAPTLPLDAAGAIDAAVVAPTVVARSSLVVDGTTEGVILAGHLPGGLGEPPITDGRAVRSAGELVVDDRAGAAVGDRVEVAGRGFTVVGRSTDTTLLAGIPLVFMTLEDGQDLVFKSRDVISAVLVTGPIGEIPDGTVALTSDQVAEDTFGPLESAVASVDLVRVLLWLIAAVIIGAVVYLSALERQRDFAVLKAVGVANRTLLASLAMQALFVALVAVAIAAVAQLALAPAFPLKVRVPARAYWQLPLLAAVIALLASAAGMRRVAKSDPALAFAGGS